MATRLRTRNCRQGWTTLNRGKIMTATNILKTFTLFLNTETDMRKISTTAISITILLAVSTALTSCEDTDSSSGKKNNYLEMGDARMPLYSAYTECGFWPYDPYIYYDICLLLTDVEEFDDSYYVYFEINLQGEDIEDIYFDETFTEENLLDRFGIPSGTYELGSFELPGLSIDTENQVDNDFTPFRNIINEWYAKDTSKKIRSVLKAKGNSGKHLSVIPPFGYKKDPNDKEKWLIDDDAAQIVRKIFRMYLDGNNMGSIARKLTEEGIETPKLYAENRGIKHYKAATYPEIWSRISVEYILSNYEYTGSTVNFKTKRKSFKNKKQVIQGREDWAVFEGTQEAIIDKETFETVQKMRGTKRAYTKFNEVNIFSGLLYCANCGGKMTIRRRKEDRRKDAFICSTYRKKKKNLCTEHAIKVNALEQIVLADIRKVCAYVRQYEEEFVEDFRQCSRKESARLQSSARNELKKTENRLSEIERIIVKLYKEKVCGSMPEERFELLAKNYETEQAELKDKAVKLRTSLETAEETANSIAKFITLVRSYTEVAELTPEILNSFIDKIYIGKPERINGQRVQEVKIVYKLVGAVNIPQ